MRGTSLPFPHTFDGVVLRRRDNFDLGFIKWRLHVKLNGNVFSNCEGETSGQVEHNA
jgi:hypothetical protein